MLGGVASGKSLVTEQLAQFGAAVLDADQTGHEILRLPQIEAAARKRWGVKVFDTDGRIDRTSLARIVFSDSPDAKRERTYLEQLTHPEIARRLKQQLDALAASDTEFVVLDAPLLLEAGWDDFCEKLLFVDAPEKVRRKRALARGWNEEDFAARQRIQQSLDVKRERADVVIDNSGLPEQTRVQVEQFWQSLSG